MRPAFTLLFLLPLAACTEVTPTPLAKTTASVATASATPAPSAPTSLTCPGGRPPLHANFYSVAQRTFSTLLETWSAQRGQPSVDRKASRIWFLRADGTAHTRLDYSSQRTGPAAPEWFVDGMVQCDDHARWRDVAAPTVPVEITIGHCWVEPVEVDGRRWDVAEEDQFGWGGPMPRGVATGERPGLASELTTSGRFSLAGEVATYRDESGVRLTLVPAGGPWTVKRGGCD